MSLEALKMELVLIKFIDAKLFTHEKLAQKNSCKLLVCSLDRFSVIIA
jgi:hypothetical protein